MTIHTFMRLARRGDVVFRSIVTSVVVGAVLIAINHGMCIASGRFTADGAHNCWLSCGLTLIVPYVVSTVSSVLAIRD